MIFGMVFFHMFHLHNFCYVPSTRIVMAKITKSKPIGLIQKERLTKDCWVNLKRLNRETIERYTVPYPSTTTYNISAKIHKNVLKISKTIMTTTDDTFNVDIKIDAEKLSIKRSKIAIDEPISSRVLRPRTAAAITSLSPNLKKNRKPDLIVAKPHSKPINKMVEEAWKLCKSDSSREKCNIRPSDIVMAKLKGHPAWPAVVLEYISKTRVKVEFFGANKTEKFGFVNISEITPFESSADVIRLNLKRNIFRYKKAVKEAVCAVPSNALMLASLIDDI